ncbi:UNVERIFIED_CONTAM: hypothetical protein DES50_108190 [Williamsia faeni]
MGFDEVSERSYERLTVEHLERLRVSAVAERERMFRQNPRLEVYRNRVVLVALCQGAAWHYRDPTVGVKDFDVYTFYAAHPTERMNERAKSRFDFGRSIFGIHPDELKKRRPRKGRHIDLMRKLFNVKRDADPIEALHAYLNAQETDSAYFIAEKSVIGLEPESVFGRILWPLAKVGVSPVDESTKF